jgi:hypothetical protein
MMTAFGARIYVKTGAEGGVAPHCRNKGSALRSNAMTALGAQAK